MEYWDSRSHANRVAEEFSALHSKRLRHRLAPEEWLSGNWSERHRFNVPGPFYGAETDTCGCGVVEAPDNVLVDENCMEFVWRQPRNVPELTKVIHAAWCDPFSGYGWDGDSYWSAESVRDWWGERHKVSEWIDRRLRDGRLRDSADSYDLTTVRTLRAFAIYLGDSLENHLREYVFWLETNRSRRADEPLPTLTR